MSKSLDCHGVSLGEGRFPDVRDKVVVEIPPRVFSASRDIVLYVTQNLKYSVKKLKAKDRQRFSLSFG